MSATPIRAQTVFISGKLLSSSRSTSFSRLMVSDSELPGRRNVCIAMSPSSSSEMNSPPLPANVNPVAISIIRHVRMTVRLRLNANLSAGWYMPTMRRIICSLKCSRLCSIRARRPFALSRGFISRADTIGTYVRQSRIAPSTAKENVYAIGLNILPLMPERKSIGVKTIKMMSCPKKAECIMVDADL